MDIKLDQKTQAWLDSTTAALLLFRKKTLIGLSPYARKLLPGLSPGGTLTELLGQETAEELETSTMETLLLPLEIMGLRYDGTFSRAKDDLMLELVLPTEALSASAFRSMAEGLAEPLTAIMALLPKLLPQLEESEKNMERAAQVNKSLYTMRRAVNNIQFAAREQELQPVLHHNNMTLWFGELKDEIKYLLETADRHLVMEIPEKSYMCDADLRLLERALMNVISNAIKFTQSGDTITLSLTKLGSRLRITVQDEGCGIPNYQMGKVFCQHEYREPSHDPRQGIGLGLGMARKIMQAHGGNLLLESQEGEGTKVHLALPASQEQSVMPLATKVLRPDYGGGFHKFLLELSDALPSQVFDTRGIDL